MVEVKYFKNENDAVIHIHDGKIKYEHYQDWDNFETWDEYDEKGRLIHRKNSEGLEYSYEYTKNGYIKRFSNTNGFTSTTEYFGDKISYKNSYGYEWSKRDEEYEFTPHVRENLGEQISEDTKPFTFNTKQ